jgi:prephenate dehydrogenase
MVVVGVGLIGGSLALDVRRRGLVGEIIGVGRGEKNLKFAQRQGIIDRYVTRETDIPESTDLLMMATPFQTDCSRQTFSARVTAGCIVSDVAA